MFCNAFPGYKLYHVSRDNRTGGGVAAYIKNCYNVTLLSDLDKYDTFEHVTFKINSISKNTDVIISVIYRPPNTSLASFNTDFFQFLEQLNYYSNKNTNFLLAGDFNINILNQAENLTVKFLDNMYANNLIPTINLPTRIPDYTATLIDNIYTTYKNITNASIIYCDITDHLPIILALKINKFHVINNRSRFFVI